MYLPLGHGTRSGGSQRTTGAILCEQPRCFSLKLSGATVTIDSDIKTFVNRDGSACDNVWDTKGKKTGLHCYRSK